MRIGCELEHVSITLLERCPRQTPTEGDVRVHVAVVLGEFCGAYDSIWLERPVLAKFVEDLRGLELTRAGEATLQSMSPGELTLKFRSRDNLGHIVVEVLLQRFQYSGPTYWPVVVSGGFELDPTDLPRILKQFYELSSG
ncbi:WapI family immunity protein [Lysobacter gummosus]|uniref:WapI family immunity protein n=1 Tax=Lysobacter TaxID=68 RepID=UPI003CCE0E07